MAKDIEKEDEERIQKFEELNNLKKDNYLFATEEKKGFYMMGNVSDEFVYHIIVTLLMEHATVLEMILGNIFDAADTSALRGIINRKKDPNCKLN